MLPKKNNDFRIVASIFIGITAVFTILTLSIFLLLTSNLSKNINKARKYVSPVDSLKEFITKILKEGDLDVSVNTKTNTYTITPKKAPYKAAETEPAQNIDTNNYEVDVENDANYTVDDNIIPTTPTPNVQPQQPVRESCSYFKITTPTELASNGCYSPKQYYEISSYYAKYETALSQRRFAETGISITCEDKDFFGKACDDYKKTLAKAKDDISKYKALILEIIKDN